MGVDNHHALAACVRQMTILHHAVVRPHKQTPPSRSEDAGVAHNESWGCHVVTVHPRGGPACSSHAELCSEPAWLDAQDQGHHGRLVPERGRGPHHSRGAKLMGVTRKGRAWVEKSECVVVPVSVTETDSPLSYTVGAPASCRDSVFKMLPSSPIASNSESSTTIDGVSPQKT